jgi:PrtD family type I secretion system ABC transporter
VLDSIFSGQWHALMVVGCFSVVFNLLMLTAPLFMLAVFSNVMTSKNADTLILLSAAAGLALLFQGLIDYVRTRLLVRIGIALELAIGPRVAEAMIEQAGHDGVADRRPLADSAEIRKFVTDVGVMTLIDIPFVPLYLLVLYWIHPLLGVLGLSAVLALLLLAVVHDWLTRRPAEAAQAASRRATAFTAECMGNADAVRAMGMAPAVVGRLRQASLDSLEALQEGADRAAVSRALVRTLRIGVQIAIYAVGAWLFLEEQLMVGAIVAASVLLGRALSPLEYAVFAWRSAMAMRQSWHRLGALLAELDSGKGKQRAEDEPDRSVVDVRRAVLTAPGSGRVLLNQISLAVDAGEVLGIIGPTGAGKSLLGRLLVGLAEPRTGLVLLKGRRVESGRTVSGAISIGYCPQEPQLFSGSIADNISRFAPGDCFSSVVAAARQVGLHERIEALPDGYATLMAAEGHPLSAGLRQQVALARAFYGTPDLIVLDEPAAWIDQSAQASLLQALDRVAQRGGAAVVITHQPGLLRSADRLAVMRNGAIDVLGPRNAVLRRITNGQVAGSTVSDARRRDGGAEASNSEVSPATARGDAEAAPDRGRANRVSPSLVLAAPAGTEEVMK